MRQDCSAYAEEPLRTVGLLEAAHQYSLQDMCGSASIPVPTVLPIQERQLNNLKSNGRHCRIVCARVPARSWQTRRAVSKQLLVLRRRDRHPAVAVELTGARTVTGTRPDNASEWPYLLGLLAMIKCSICSYQCDN